MALWHGEEPANLNTPTPRATATPMKVTQTILATFFLVVGAVHAAPMPVPVSVNLAIDSFQGSPWRRSPTGGAIAPDDNSPPAWKREDADDNSPPAWKRVDVDDNSPPSWKREDVDDNSPPAWKRVDSGLLKRKVDA
jgi:hypothetical protein